MKTHLSEILRWLPTVRRRKFFWISFLFASSASATAVGQSNPPALKEDEAAYLLIEGEKYYQLQDKKKALEIFEEGFSKFPKQSVFSYKIAQTLSSSAQIDDLQKAVRHIEKAISLNPQEQSFYRLAYDLYNSQRQWKEAAKTMEILAVKFNCRECWQTVAELYENMGNSAEAISAWQQYQRYKGPVSQAFLAKHKLYAAQDKRQEALNELQQLYQTHPKEEEFALTYFDALLQQGNKAQAVGLAETFVKENPASGKINLWLVQQYRQQGNVEKEKSQIATFTQNTSSPIEDRLTWLKQRIKNISPDMPAAERESFSAFFQQLEKDYPTNEQAQLLGAKLALQLRQPLVARQRFVKAIALGANDFAVWQETFAIDAQLRKADSLLARTESALELFPRQGLVYYYQGYAFLLQKKFALAKEALTTAQRLSYKNPALSCDIQGLLGDAWEGLGDHEQSEKIFQEALACNPKNYHTLNRYSNALANRKIKLREAEKYSLQCVTDKPEEAEYWRTYAWTLYQQKKYKEAQTAIKKAFSCTPPPQAHELYGDILYRLGDIPQAVAQWEKAQTEDAASPTLLKKISQKKMD